MQRFVLIATASVALLLVSINAATDGGAEAGAPLSLGTSSVGAKVCFLDGICPNGEGFGRDPTNNCEFPACLEFADKCIEGTLNCGNSVVLARDPNNHCFFPACPRDFSLVVGRACNSEPPYGRPTEEQTTRHRHAVCDVRYCFDQAEWR